MIERTVLASLLCALAAGSASASLTIAYQDLAALGKLASHTIGTGVSTSAGDVIVVTQAASAVGVPTYDFTSSDGGVVSLSTDIAWDNTKNVRITSYQITTGGTFDFSVTNADVFNTMGFYLLRADSGDIQLLDSDAVFTAADTVNPTTHTVNLSWTGTESGVVITAISGSVDSGQLPVGLTHFSNSGNNRYSSYGTFTNATSLSYDWIIPINSGNARSGGVAFAEVAVPEPSTIALILGCITMGFVLYRRTRS